MPSARLFRLSLFFFLFLACGKNMGAAISTAFPKAEEVHAPTLSKKEKRKTKRHFFKKWKAKLLKFFPSKERKNKFGRIGLIILLGGVASLFITDILFGLALIASGVLGLLGILNDEDKRAA